MFIFPIDDEELEEDEEDEEEDSDESDEEEESEGSEEVAEGESEESEGEQEEEAKAEGESEEGEEGESEEEKAEGEEGEDAEAEALDEEGSQKKKFKWKKKKKKPKESRGGEEEEKAEGEEGAIEEVPPEEQLPQEPDLLTLSLEIKDEILSVLPRGKKKLPKRQVITFWFDEVNFDSEVAYKKCKKDYSFFLKFQKYNLVTNFVRSNYPFAHTYEKQCWDLTLFNKLCSKVRKLSPLNSAPFYPGGISAFFEFEILNSPQSCAAYVARSRELTARNLKLFERAYQDKNADIFEEAPIPEIHTEDNVFKVSKFLLSGVDSYEAFGGPQQTPTSDVDRKGVPSEIAPETLKPE